MRQFDVYATQPEGHSLFPIHACPSPDHPYSWHAHVKGDGRPLVRLLSREILPCICGPKRSAELQLPLPCQNVGVHLCCASELHPNHLPLLIIAPAMTPCTTRSRRESVPDRGPSYSTPPASGGKPSGKELCLYVHRKLPFAGATAV